MRAYQKWTLLGLLLANLVVFLILGAAVIYQNNQSESPNVVTATPGPVMTAAPTQDQSASTATPETSFDSVQLSAQQLEAGPDLDSVRFPLGQSVDGRSINSFAFPSNAGDAAALVLVNGIHGDETNAWPVLESIMTELLNQTLEQPANLSLYFIESLNPDGTANNDRLNANGVDLNRNWDTYDWKMRVEVGSFQYLAHGGGAEPFSEPETRLMRDFLVDLKANHPRGVTVIYFHAAFPPRGMVLPGLHHVNGQDVADTPSRELGLLLAEIMDYGYSNVWTGNYTVTGDATTWAVAQGIPALTVELPVSTPLEPEAAQTLQEGVLTLIETLGNE